MIGLLLMLIVAVAAFNIIATLIMVVADKRADIAILRTLGATPRQIMAIFMVQGSIIGLSGTLIGVVLGVLGALNVSSLVGWLERVSGQHIFSSDAISSAACHQSCRYWMSWSWLRWRFRSAFWRPYIQPGAPRRRSRPRHCATSEAQRRPCWRRRQLRPTHQRQ